MVHIGDKIRQLREEQGLSRAELCDDEAVLTSRQLVRIENGVSSPTIKKIQYIAARLGVPSYQLMEDFEDLPVRYKELKYFLLRQPTYGIASKIKHAQDILDDIFTHFYDELPKEEQFIIDCIQAKFEIVLNKDIRYAEDIIGDYIQKFKKKDHLALSDLSFFRLLSIYFEVGEESHQSISEDYVLIFKEAFDKLLNQISFFTMENLFVFSNSILTGLAFYGRNGDYSLYPKGIDLLKTIFEETQDYQKRPLLSMLEWKVDIFENSDVAAATLNYEKAKDLAKLLDVEPMITGLEFEWKQDLEKFYNKS